MDALDLLEQQHAEALVRLDYLAAEPRLGQRGLLVGALVRWIGMHLDAEEQHVYRALTERASGGEHAPRLRAALEAHSLVRFAADNLARTRVTDLRFGARLMLLRWMFAEHADQEECFVFQRAKSALTDEQLDRAGQRIAVACDFITPERARQKHRRIVPPTPRRRARRAL